MRTTQLKLNNQTTEAILVAGGPGFKIYTATGVNGWILVLGRNRFIVDEKDSAYKMVSRYVNLKYQSINQQETIKQEFDSFIQSRIQPTPNAEPTV